MNAARYPRPPKPSPFLAVSGLLGCVAGTLVGILHGVILPLRDAGTIARGDVAVYLAAGAALLCWGVVLGYLAASWITKGSVPFDRR